MASDSSGHDSQSILNYVLVAPRAPITLNLFEAERYESAVVVQPLIGNLVYYSNRGRYEPKLARSWSRVDSFSWRFTMHQGLFCENGEAITAESFRKSILRSLRVLTKKSDFPIFNRLVGFQEFKAGGDLPGIQAHGDDLTFKFDKPLRSGLLQLLSFAPFGYICTENVTADGTWKDDLKFISSGPFRIESLELGKSYLLTRNPKWTLGFKENAPQMIKIGHTKPSSLEVGAHWIVDSFNPVQNLPKEFSEYRLVPEYINPILMGNFEKGYFASVQNRQYFRGLLEKHRSNLPNRWDGHTRSTSFYPNQDSVGRERPILNVRPTTVPSEKIRIGGVEPKEGGQKEKTWLVLKSALVEAGLPFEFVGEKTTMAALGNRQLDLRMVGGSVGGGVEPWGISILFCSDLGPSFPDPSGRICRIVDDFENDRIDEKDFSSVFFKIVDEDAALVAVSHFGIQLFLSAKINRDSISPLMSVMRFEDLGLER